MAESARVESPVGQVTVLHVTECTTGGVPHAIGVLVDVASTARHVRVSLPLREEAPGGGARRRVQGMIAAVASVRSWRRSLRGALDEVRPDYVHVHSSVAGVLARTCRLGLPRRAIVYSPHCFAFERTDVSRALRLAFALVEVALLVRTGSLYVLGEREAALLSRAARIAGVRIVVGYNPVTSPVASRSADPAPASIVTVGRVGPQKDPDFLIEVKESVDRRRPGNGLRWTWVGSGDPDAVDRLAAAGVSVTGWVDPAEVSRALIGASVYVHTASWEAFPLSLVEAAQAGLPIVVRRVPSMPGTFSQLGGERPDDVAHSLLSLDDEEARAAALERSRQIVAELDPRALATVLHRLYARPGHADSRPGSSAEAAVTAGPTR